MHEGMQGDTNGTPSMPVQVIPFLVLAVGVDNIFILADALGRTDEGTPLERRMGAALAAAGPSITLAACAGALPVSGFLVCLLDTCQSPSLCMHASATASLA